MLRCRARCEPIAAGRPCLHKGVCAGKLSADTWRRSKKRRVEEVDDEHHGEFDANELRQHEEFTKVKNVDAVELGQYEMETWYFSPLPADYNNCKVGHPALRWIPSRH